MSYYCIGLIAIAFCAAFGVYMQRKSGAILGENVTYNIRQVLYKNILSKNIAYFDNKDNGVGVITSIMASETMVINGACSESLTPVVEGLSALLIADIIGLIFCWPIALIHISLSPFVIYGQWYAMNAMFAAGRYQSDSHKDANLLCGDAINNFKTV